MRAEGLLTIERGKFGIKDGHRLQVVGDFDPGYLHLHPR
jgi:hypothetical protein